MKVSIRRAFGNVIGVIVRIEGPDVIVGLTHEDGRSRALSKLCVAVRLGLLMSIWRSRNPGHLDNDIKDHKAE